MLGKAIVALVIAALVAWLELVTSKYPRTIGLFWRRWGLLVYAGTYGLISFGFTFGYSYLVEIGTFAAPADATQEPTWPIVVGIGLSAKALLHIRLFSVPAAASQQVTPVGTESIVLLFEPWLLRTIVIQEFVAVSDYIAGKVKNHNNLATVQAKITAGIPNTIPTAEREALLLDVQKTTDVGRAIELFLRAFGPTVVDRVFP